MLNKPKFMSPSTNMQDYTLDANADELWFSCITDGNEAIYAWRIQIYELNSGTLVYDTGMIADTNADADGAPKLPFVPINEKNQNVKFSVNIKNINKPPKGLVNSTEPYYWIISFWNSVDSTVSEPETGKKPEDFPTTQSCEEVFYLNPTPTLTLQYKKVNVDSTEGKYVDFENDVIFDSKEYFFKADYSVKSDIKIPVKRYGWKLIDKDSNQTLLDTISQNQVYGTSDNIICSYNGFVNGANYEIQACVETQNGLIIYSDKQTFSVSYNTTFLTSDFKTEVLTDEAAVINNWGESSVIGGSISGVYKYLESYPISEKNGNPTNSLYLEKDSKLLFDYGATSNLDIDESSHIVLSTQLHEAIDTELFLAEGLDNSGNELVRRLSYEDEKFIYTVKDANGVSVSEYKPVNAPGQYVWYVIVMPPYLEDDTSLIVSESIATNGLSPKTDLAPSENLMPSLGDWTLQNNQEDDV